MHFSTKHCQRECKQKQYTDGSVAPCTYTTIYKVQLLLIAHKTKIRVLKKEYERKKTTTFLFKQIKRKNHTLNMYELQINYNK